MTSEMLDEDSWLSESDVAEMINVAAVTLKGWRRSGRGPKFYRLGPRLIRYRAEDVDVWLRSQAVEKK